MKEFRDDDRLNPVDAGLGPSPDLGSGRPALEDGLPQPQRAFAFATIGIAIMMAVLDSSIMNVALPTIAERQGVAPATAISVVMIYQLAVVISLLPFAALGDSLGFRRIYFVGVILFGGASYLCSQATSMEMLNAARLLQGFGAGALMSINGAMVRHIMPANRIGSGLARISLIVGVSAASGPTVAGVILALASWQWLFLINLPLSLVILLSGLVTLPRMAGSRRRFDWISATLNAAAFGLTITGLTALGSSGWSGMVAVKFGLAALAFLALTLRLKGAVAPMLPLDLLRIRPFAMAIVASVCSFVTQFIVFVSLPFLFSVLGRSAVETGLLLTPWPVATAIVAPLAGKLSDRHAPEYLSLTGLAILTLGFLSLATMPKTPDDLNVAWRLMVCGIGFGLFQAPNNRVVMTTAPRNRSGGASGLQSTARVLGQSIGAALAALMIGAAADFTLAPVMGLAIAFCVVAIAATLLRASLSSRL
ncbi:MFS transporter [Hoeflea sp.]|uniref:MFS transporter n=1 Tax=Hoeflea sp. TaxID=1940281 RepID=UPI0019A31D84|nr:MFS transporter [Hoeflea sp.]MBC7284439.1 MFS transporter [Hoeflea sp.]